MIEHEKLFIGCLGEGLKEEKGRDQGGPGKTTNLRGLQVQVPAAQVEEKIWGQSPDSCPA